MLLFAQIAFLGAVTVCAIVLLTIGCLGTAPLSRLRASPRALLVSRVRAIAPYAAFAVVVFGANNAFRWTIRDVAADSGIRATALIYAIEGDLVAWIQDALPELSMYVFAVVYVIGYPIVVLFPIVGYFLASVGHLKTLLVAYTLNSAIGTVMYASVHAYGPRNHRPELVDRVLLEIYPDITTLTSQVNAETNVFPSLHVSMSVTALLLAIETREPYPRWTAVAAVLTGTIALATMALGIHWAVDVVGGIALAVGSVAIARVGVAAVERRRAH